MSGAVDQPPPSPYGARDLDELVGQLGRLRLWSGRPYREIHRAVRRSRQRRGVAEIPTYNTVYRCFQAGRRRVDVDLLVDIAYVLLGDEERAEHWRRAHQVVADRAAWAGLVSVAGTLPDDIDAFVGRATELDALLAGGGGVVAIAGMGGIGKTRLAVRAAHRLTAAGRYGDLRLVVNLRGFDATLPPVDPAAVLDGFLRHLGVAADEIHGLDLAARGARFRRAIAGRDALLLLDDAASEEQVAPLLPDSPDCLAVVTSRRHLAGLPGARHVALDAFTEPEAVELLDGIADRPAALRIAELTGRLPLALALAAGRIRQRDDWTLADHVEHLAEHAARLCLEDGVELALRLSYDALAADAQRLLRRLALHPGRDFDAAAVAALAGIDLPTARRRLGELHASNVVARRGDDRYELHDLVRVFAAGRAGDEDPVSARHAALRRLFDHYRFLAARAADVYAPQERHRRPAVPDPGSAVPDWPDQAAAVGWLEAERANLMAAARHAAALGWAGYVGDLSIVLYAFLDLCGHTGDAVTLHRHAADLGEGRTRGYALIQLGTAYWRTGRSVDAMGCFESAATLFHDIGEAGGRARAVGNLGLVLQGLGRYDEALAAHGLAVSLFGEIGDRTGQSRGYGNAGCVHVGRGDYRAALADFERSLALAGEADDRAGAGATLANIGCCHEKLGNLDEALEHHEKALAIAREVGHRDGLTQAVCNIGTVLSLLGRPEEALCRHDEALALARDSGSRQVEVTALNGGGTARRQLGRLDEAIDWHRQALALAEELGDREEIGRAHAEIGRARAAAGAARHARLHWARALAVFEEIGAPEAKDVATWLAA